VVTKTAAAEQERYTPPVPTAVLPPVNWCGKRDGDGDGIYCGGE
jgi:hypothetical protein